MFVKDSKGVWNDTCTLYSCKDETIVDANGDVILVQRDSTGTDTYYKSANLGLTIDFFIWKVLYDE